MPSGLLRALLITLPSRATRSTPSRGTLFFSSSDEIARSSESLYSCHPERGRMAESKDPEGSESTHFASRYSLMGRVLSNQPYRLTPSRNGTFGKSGFMTSVFGAPVER